METSVTSKFQVVIPKSVREKLNIKAGQKLIAYSIGDQVIFSPKKKWPEEYLQNLKGLWKKVNIRNFVKNERDSWQ